MRPVRPRAVAQSAVHPLLLLLMLISTAMMPVFARAEAASPTPLDVLRELRHQSEEIASAAAEADWDGATVAAGAARAALDRLQTLMEEPAAGGDARRLERRFVDADDFGDLLTGVEDALGSRDLPALTLYGAEATELASRMLANCELNPARSCVPGRDSGATQSRSQLMEGVWK